MTDIRKQLLAAFDVEHREHLQAIRKALDSADRGAPFEMADIFRRAHSLKGAARAVDLPAVEEIAHQLETLFSHILEGSQALDRNIAASVRASLDAIEDLVTEASHSSDSAPSRVVTRDPARGGEQEGKTPRSSETPATGRAIATEKAGQTSDTAGTYLRVAAEQIEELSSSMHQLLSELQTDEAMAEALRQIELDARGLRRSWDVLHSQMILTMAGASRPSGSGVERPRNLSSRLRDFDQDLGRLFRKLSALSRSHKLSTWTTDQAARQVRESIERVSLVSAETVFGTFGHMVREIARETGRDVHVRISGLDIQADRRVLQALKDPVMHLLRNAVSHGAEDAAERIGKGKSERAEVILELASHGGRLAVSVRDDGRGPDLARIEQVAIERGLLQPRRAGDPAPLMDQLLSLVFSPGFSTADSVDRLSGRGMGLSVVAEAVRKLQGSVLLRPRFPWGTEAILSVPFTAARQPLLLVEAEGRIFGLPTYGVERLFRLNVQSLESVQGRPTVRIDVRGQDVIVPVIAFAALAGSSNAPLPIEAGYAKAVLIRHGSRYCALAVNAFHDVRTMLVNDVQAVGLGDTVSGTVLLEDEMPALVLSPELLIEHWIRNESRLAAGGLGLAGWTSAATSEPGATVLVVDDSITTRTLEKSILEAQGYRVLLSVDGIDALNALRSGDAMVDLVVADVEMPRMDGFGLLQAIKTDPRLSAIPVILMTSRADPADVRRGLDLGASAYITKQKFDQRELLATIGQLL
ncbi:hybrid sensor histidine kinase/response regulator [Microvirga puerhi]|uniref:histidine kinase n=1 Tax=Microvirga puerhi TaxID=2876078 RepID=A0ABS7VS11_9HYPH|nr:response regulator [Microvirga puerhi]